MTAASGSITLQGVDLGRRSPRQRARAGLGRTFQQNRLPAELTIGEVLATANRRAGQRCPSAARLIEFFDLGDESTLLATVDGGTRRIVDVALAIAGGASVVLLDEPAAGLGAEQAVQLCRRIRAIPSTFGCAVVLVEHNVSLVSDVVDQVVVLDFGCVLAHGAATEVLRRQSVIDAYLGE